MFRRFGGWMLAVLMIGALAACGGGGGDSSMTASVDEEGNIIDDGQPLPEETVEDELVLPFSIELQFEQATPFIPNDDSRELLVYAVTRNRLGVPIEGVDVKFSAPNGLLRTTEQVCTKFEEVTDPTVDPTDPEDTRPPTKSVCVEWEDVPTNITNASGFSRAWVRVVDRVNRPISITAFAGNVSDSRVLMARGTTLVFDPSITDDRAVCVSRDYVNCIDLPAKAEETYTYILHLTDYSDKSIPYQQVSIVSEVGRLKGGDGIIASDYTDADGYVKFTYEAGNVKIKDVLSVQAMGLEVCNDPDTPPLGACIKQRVSIGEQGYPGSLAFGLVGVKGYKSFGFASKQSNIYNIDIEGDLLEVEVRYQKVRRSDDELVLDEDDKPIMDPIPGAILDFDITRGRVFDASLTWWEVANILEAEQPDNNFVSVTTDADGRARVKVASTNAGLGMLTARVRRGLNDNKVTRGDYLVNYVATRPARIEIQASPQVVAVTDSATEAEGANTSSIRVQVLDRRDNVVERGLVRFALDDNTGGALVPAKDEESATLVETDKIGRANVTYQAGGRTSGLNGVKVMGSIQARDGMTLSAEVPLTVYGRAAFIRLFTNGEAARDSANNGWVDYAYWAQVVDISGRAISGVEVSSALVSTHYYKGFWWLLQPELFTTYNELIDALGGVAQELFNGIFSGLLETTVTIPTVDLTLLETFNSCVELGVQAAVDLSDSDPGTEPPTLEEIQDNCMDILGLTATDLELPDEIQNIEPPNSIENLFDLLKAGDDTPVWVQFKLPSTLACPSEDFDRDGFLDPGEDLNNNGMIDPGNVAVLANVGPTPPGGNLSTDDSGMVEFEIRHPWQYSTWIRVALDIGIMVEGTENSRSVSFDLPLPDNDVARWEVTEPGDGKNFNPGFSKLPPPGAPLHKLPLARSPDFSAVSMFFIPSPFGYPNPGCSLPFLLTLDS